MTSRLIFAVACLAAAPAHAWNGLGHKVVADIAWQTLDAPTRERIVATLRRHPRFDDDFAKQTPRVNDDARWVFQHAATWPDIVRGLQGEELATYHMGTWHYVNFPLFVGGERPTSFNRSVLPEGSRTQWNVIQAFNHCRATIESDATPAEKAVAYCWIFHLVGDIHQPLHATALVCDRFPTGDRGGNSVPVAQGHNLHSLWDGLLGRQDRMTDVAREVAELKENRPWWKVDTRPDFVAWVNESRKLAEAEVYSPEILHAVEQPGELRPINLPESYLQDAGEAARPRIVAAGLRLGVLLGGKVKGDP